MGLTYVADGIFVDDDPISPEEIREIMGADWSPKLELIQVHPFVEFKSLERAYYGLSIHTLNPAGVPKLNPATESVNVGTQMFENVAPLRDFSEAFELIEKGSVGLLEEFPFSEIEEEVDYNKVMGVLLDIKVPTRTQDWSPYDKSRIKLQSAWNGPGVYDMRDKPPTKQAESVEKYELDGMEYWAGDTLDFMFQGDEWKEKLRELLVGYLEGLS
jgi:hypothetical protein